MKLTIEIEMNNAAFDGDPLPEIIQLLGQAVGKISMQLVRPGAAVCDALEAADKLLDSNGNTVGTVRVE